MIHRQLSAAADSEATTYREEELKGAIVVLPNRPRDDARPEVETELRARAAEECRLAADGDALRQFDWQWQSTEEAWSLRLLPVVTSYYTDNDGVTQPVVVDTIAGGVVGVRRASLKRALAASAAIFAVAAGSVALAIARYGPVDRSTAIWWLALGAAAILVSAYPLMYVAQVNQEASAT
jgi:hypothetical protein